MSASAVRKISLGQVSLSRYKVNFSGEQRTLVEAEALYRGFPAVRIPKLIRPLCTPTITALTEEPGIKVTSTAGRLPVLRRRAVAKQLVEALVVVPFSLRPGMPSSTVIPTPATCCTTIRPANSSSSTWALRERLSREQRRHLALLFLMVSLRDPVGTSNELLALSQARIRLASPRGQKIRETVGKFLDELPPSCMPSGADAMRLLERIAIDGVKFPSSLIMLSKVMFILEGILGDIVGADTGMGFTLARHLPSIGLPTALLSVFRS